MMTTLDNVMRSIFELPDEQAQTLDALCRRLGVSRAEVIRRVLSAYLHDFVASDREAFGLWKARSEESLAYEDALRAEWENER